MSSRVKMSARNAFWNYFSMIISFGLSVISRTVFVYTLGENYLGVNGLFSNVLGVLSFAELGIGTAMGFSLYKPVAENNREKIKSYMYYYKWSYRIIAVVVAALGLAVTPFLHYLLKDPGDVGNVTIYYLIFLFNTVSSYFVSYKFSLVNAEQKNYIYTNINLLISAMTTIVQIISLVLFHDFTVYLSVAAVIGIFQKIAVSMYFDKMYPYLKEKEHDKLSKEEIYTLITKIKALVVHKIGEVSVHQTDNIIVSVFVSTRMVGLLSNYNLMIGTISSYISILFNSATGSLGNMVALESKEYQYSIFKKYRFIGFWFYGFTAIALFLLMKPFVILWFGERMVVDQTVIALILIDYYMIGQRICLNNIKSAAGIFEQDKYVALVQAVVNLVASILLVRLIGLPGVYLGTIIQGTISSVIKPIVSYKLLFNLSSRYYFIDSLKYMLTVLVAYAACQVFAEVIMAEVTVVRFIIMMTVVAVIPNLIFFLTFRRTEEFEYVKTLICSFISRRKK